MKKNIVIIMLLILTTLIFVSCKSTPDTQEQKKSITIIIESKAKAEAARQRAVDFESPAYFPSDWELIEAQYNAAGEMPSSNAAEIQQIVAEYNAAAASYDSIFEKTVPLYAQAREDEILSTRDSLISSGFTDYFPEYLKAADDITLEALEQYEAGDYYKSRDTAKKALNEYENLLAGAHVYLARREVIDRDFVKYDEANFAKADVISQTALDKWEAGDKDAAVENAEEAQLRYNLVLSNGWVNYAAERKKYTAAEREKAIAERANIASRDIFSEAEAILNTAEENFSQKNYNEASLQYTDAEALFAIARQDTAEKRRKAEEAIRMAEDKIIESNDTAVEAQRVIEGGSR